MPASFPFVSIEAAEVTHSRTVEVEPGVTEPQPYTMMTVIAMREGIVPEAPEPAPTWNEQMEAQLTYTAMMTDTLLEV